MGTDTGSGDSGDSAETSPTGGPFSCEGLEAVPEAVFPERIAEVVCAQTVACGCSPGEKEMFQCKGWEEFFGDARTYAKEQGRVYDGMCVAQKLHALANAGCSERDYVRIGDCGDCPIYTSLIPTGGACEDRYGGEPVAACAEPDDFCDFGTCRPIAKEGEK